MSGPRVPPCRFLFLRRAYRLDREPRWPSVAPEPDQTLACGHARDATATRKPLQQMPLLNSASVGAVLACWIFQQALACAQCQHFGRTNS